MKTYIVIHHSATVDGDTVSWGAIEKFHKEVNGWRDIGYHYGIERIGLEGYYALMGRDENSQAAAVAEANLNVTGIHICCVGDYDKIAPPIRMIEVMIERIILPVMHRHSITPDRIIGHRDGGLMAGFDWTKGQYKSCPGRLFDLNIIRTMVK
jgi:N-acetyl-anhydromuramyl-L-alanine amidase AmpD